MKTIILPNHEFGTNNENIDNLRRSDYVNYGYIKQRDIEKWENNEVVAVKMGMLDPTRKSYDGLTIVQSAEQRIDNQDNESNFEDGDELICVFCFVSKETDYEWRGYLMNEGFKVSRTSKNREGIYISKEDVFYHYSKHYGIDVEEIEKRMLEKECDKKKKESDKLMEELDKNQEEYHKLLELYKERREPQILQEYQKKIKEHQEIIKKVEENIKEREELTEKIKESTKRLNTSEFINIWHGFCLN